MNPKARITFRFNESQPGPTNKLTQPVADEDNPRVVPLVQQQVQQPANEEPTLAWNSPFQNDAEALEHLIRDTAKRHKPLAPHVPDKTMPVIDLGKEIDFAAVPAREPLALKAGGEQISLPTVLNHYTPATDIPVTTGRKPSGPSWMKVLLSVAGALATGALFGYMVLYLFVMQSGPSEQPEQSAVIQPAEPQEGSGGGQVTIQNEEQQKPKSNGATVQLDLPARSYYLLQYGVFSNAEGMNASAAELKAKGLAAAEATADGYRVYAGFSGERSQALALSHQLGELDVYIKQVELPAASAVAFSGEADQLADFLDKTDSLLRTIGDWTGNKLQEESQETSSAELWQQSHPAWTTAAEHVKSGISEQGKAGFERLLRSVNTAVVTLGEYNKKPSRAHLWTAQSSLMEAIFAEKEWLEQIIGL
ncbi:SPOR domain-containing protein [Paenibacillaceae bacterium]|nr:SPOR domain-containing protein [Paenibacillaceae bacterium]